MIEQITEDISYQKGYDKGWADAQEHLAKKFDKILGKATSQAYDKGLKRCSENKDNKPCVCGFYDTKK